VKLETERLFTQVIEVTCLRPKPDFHRSRSRMSTLQHFLNTSLLDYYNPHDCPIDTTPSNLEASGNLQVTIQY
jgi:hypothetical protein